LVKGHAAFFLHMLSPSRAIRWALWMIRSRVASAMVGSPIISCHWATGQLGGNQGRFAPVAFFEDFQKIEALLVIEAVGAPVEGEQLDTREFVDEAREATMKRP
jgi:hypothetical protein